MSLSLTGRRTPRRSRMSDAVPPGVSLVPAPGALHYRLQVREVGRPAQDPLHPVAGGDEAGGVPGQVRDVDVVADAGAIGGRVVRAVQGHGISLPGGYLEDDGDEVRLRTVVFAAPVAGAGGVEVAQGDGAYALLLIPGEHPLHHQLRLAVGVDRPQGRVFAYRHLVRLAVDGGA